MEIKVSVLASGSKGNSIYVATERVRLLVDAGLSCRELERRLASIGVRPEQLDAIVVTHEHSDHVSGLGSISRRYGLPVFLNRATFQQLPERVGPLDEKEEFTVGRSFGLGDLAIHPFSVPHDAADPVGLTLVNGNTKVGICTDLGKGTALVCHRLRHCSILVLEANHDLEMLQSGPYPWALKQRIRASTGHLSNQEAAEILSRVTTGELQHLVLAHLSEINNCPQKVLQCLAGVLGGRHREDLRLSVASQHHPVV